MDGWIVVVVIAMIANHVRRREDYFYSKFIYGNAVIPDLGF